MAIEHHAQRLAGNVFHDHPVIALGIGAEIDQSHEVGMFEVEALGHAAQLDLEIVPANQLQGHFLAAVAQRIVHLAEAAPADAPLERVAVQNPLSRAVGEFHSSTPYPSYAPTRSR